VLAFVLGSLVESSFRRSMLLFEGDPTGFVTRPISGTIIAFIVMVIALPVIQLAWRRTRSTPTSDHSDHSDQEAGVR
jgi:putative tricarboxylic transport membrane protein